LNQQTNTTRTERKSGLTAELLKLHQSLTGEAVDPSFRYSRQGDTIINGVSINPPSIAKCTARFNGREQDDLTRLAGQRLKSGDTLTLNCTRNVRVDGPRSYRAVRAGEGSVSHAQTKCAFWGDGDYCPASRSSGAVRLIRTAYCHKGFLLGISDYWKTIDRTSNRCSRTVRNISQKSGLSAQDFCGPYLVENT
jgi:hypothetical protein